MYMFCECLFAGGAVRESCDAYLCIYERGILHTLRFIVGFNFVDLEARFSSWMCVCVCVKASLYIDILRTGFNLNTFKV